jgi:hypothetical protein
MSIKFPRQIVLLNELAVSPNLDDLCNDAVSWQICLHYSLIVTAKADLAFFALDHSVQNILTV